MLTKQGSQSPADGISPPPAIRAGIHQEGGGQITQQQQRESMGTEQPSEVDKTACLDARMHRFGN
eukprot:scaffold44760_cov17-Tisochrysis_lutea.AAC.1